MQTFTLVFSIYTTHKACNLTLLLNWEILKVLLATTIDLRGLYGKTIPVNDVGTSLNFVHYEEVWYNLR